MTINCISQDLFSSHILPRLSVVDVNSFRLVCKSFENIANLYGPHLSFSKFYAEWQKLKKTKQFSDDQAFNEIGKKFKVVAHATGLCFIDMQLTPFLFEKIPTLQRLFPKVMQLYILNVKIENPETLLTEGAKTLLLKLRPDLKQLSPFELELLYSTSIHRVLFKQKNGCIALILKINPHDKNSWNIQAIFQTRLENHTRYLETQIKKSESS